MLLTNYDNQAWLSSFSLEQWHGLVFYFLIVSLILGIIVSTLSWLIGEKDKRINRVFFISIISLVLGLTSIILLEIISDKSAIENKNKMLAFEAKNKAVEDSLKNALTLSSKKISKLEKSDDRFRQELEKTYERLAKSKNPVVPRSLSPKQQKKFIKILRNLPQGKITLNSLFGDSESISFARELRSIITSAGWQITTYGINTMYSDRTPTGIEITIRNKKNIPSHANILLKAFEVIGYKAMIIEKKGKALNEINLIIGEQSRFLN